MSSDAGAKTQAAGSLPLAGVRVVDMTVVWSGTFATQMLADLGAEVIRVESTRFAPYGTRGVVVRPSPALLQAEGVAAGPVMDERDCYRDPHLGEREFFERVDHPECGVHLYPGAPWKMSGTPCHIRKPPCRLGEDNEYVYKSLLGVSDREYEELERDGHIGMDFDPSITVYGRASPGVAPAPKPGGLD